MGETRSDVEFLSVFQKNFGSQKNPNKRSDQKSDLL
jgi:hypothetical protein